MVSNQNPKNLKQKNKISNLIVIDTNFFLIPWQFKVDIFSEFEKLFGNYKVILLKTIHKELESLVNSNKNSKFPFKVNSKFPKKIKGSDKLAIKFALSMVDRFEKLGKITIVDDSFIVEQIEKNFRIVPNGDIVILTYILTNFFSKDKDFFQNKNTIQILNYFIDILQNHKKINSSIREDLKNKTSLIFPELFNKTFSDFRIYVATQDKTLRKILKILNISFIELKQKKYLAKSS